MGTEEWFLIKSRFKSEWEECLVLWISWNAFLLLAASFEGACFVASGRCWKLGAIKGILSCLCLPALAPLGAGSPPSAEGQRYHAQGAVRAPAWLVGFQVWRLSCSLGTCRGLPSLHAPWGTERQEAASHWLHLLPINLMDSLYRQDSGVLG